MIGHWEKLLTEAAECALIRDLATDRTKREVFARLAQQLEILASEVRCGESEQRSPDE